ncbi:hypothetical protein HRED_09682 [Candidatus Haloredivivus sp. G17]|nr:hypothetical protein HRED_09682 [Candidatus Haloredivivus sp. G17]
MESPASKREAIKQLQESGQASQYISEDYSFYDTENFYDRYKFR